MFSKKVLMSYLNSYTLLIIGLVLVLAGTILYKYREHFITSRLRKELIFFHMNSCSHCEKLRPVWNKFRQQYAENQYIDIGTVNVSERPDQAEKYGIEQFPTIVYLKDGMIVDVYQGDRTFSSLVQYLNYAIAN